MLLTDDLTSLPTLTTLVRDYCNKCFHASLIKHEQARKLNTIVLKTNTGVHAAKYGNHWNFLSTSALKHVGNSYLVEEFFPGRVLEFLSTGIFSDYRILFNILTVLFISKNVPG